MHLGISSRPAQHAPQAGFTLIEVIITVVIVSVLAAVALPAFFDQVRKSRRADAIAVMSSVQQAQDRFRANSPVFGTKFEVSGGGALLGVSVAASAATSFTTSSGYYLLTMPSVPGGTEGTRYNIRAEALGAQARDTSCLYMQVAASGPEFVNSSGPTTALGNAAAANNRCWRR
jgi:type IV pilus assembly protein PilE